MKHWWLNWPIWNVNHHMPRSWPHNSVAAVSLTFDGSTASHLDAGSHLDRAGICATFYADPASLLEDPTRWREIVRKGHELGNHALFAACDDDGLLIRMTPEAIAEELDEGRALLEEEFGVARHSAAMPLVRTLPDDSGIPAVPEVIRSSVVRLNEEALGDQLRERYSVIRTPLERFNEDIEDTQRLRCCCVDGLDAVSIGLIAQIGISQGAWIILSWGPSPDPTVVGQIARWLKKQHVWTAPVIEVATHIRESSSPSPTFQSM